MVVLPSNQFLDLQLLRDACQSQNVELAREYEFAEKFKDCDAGAMPPFGDLYGMDVYMAESLKSQDHIACNGGTHSDLIRMEADDFLQVVHPHFLAKC